MRLNLEALLILDALDRHGSFAAAAAVLFKTPSALSYMVQNWRAISTSPCSIAQATAPNSPIPAS
jgi:hypothetical protein